MEKLTKALMTDETGQAIVTKLTALSGQMHELAMATRGSAILFESESDISVLGDGGYLAVYVGSTNPLVISGWTGDNSLVTGHLYYLIKSGTAVASSDLGEYGGTAVTDTTLELPNVPADSETVGLALAEKADTADVTAIDTRVTGINNALSNYKSVINPFNTHNFLDASELGDSTTSGDIRFNFTCADTCEVSGTATSNTFKNIYVNQQEFPAWAEKGKKYSVKYGGVNVSFRVYVYISGWQEILSTLEDGTFVIPDEATGLLIRLYVASGTTVNETVRFAVIKGMSTYDLSDAVAEIEDDVSGINTTLSTCRINEYIDINSDMNDYRTAGFFYLGKTSCETGTNMPTGADVSKGAVLNVVTQVNGSLTAVVIQIMTFVNNGAVYGRRWAGGSSGYWSEWTAFGAENFLHIVGDFLSATTEKVSDNIERISRKSGYNLDNVLSAVTWESGNIATSGTETSNQNYIRSSFLATDEGDAFFTKYESANPAYRIRYYFYDENKVFTGYSFTYSAFSGDINDQAYITVGKGYIRFTIYRTPADTLPIVATEWENVDFSVKRLSFKNAEIIKVATNNVRNWGTEHSYGYTGDYESNLRFYRELYGTIQPTIMGWQEYSPYMDADHLHPASANFRDLFARMYNTISPRIPVMSNIPISGFEKGTLSTGRDYAWGTIENANGDEITYLNIHAYPGTTAEAKTNRQIEYGEILQLLDGKSFIITGDMNASEISEFDVFTDAGCNLANGGDFGTFITGTNPTLLFPFDNIITSSDIKILSAGMAESSGTSDHKMLWAEIMI